MAELALGIIEIFSTCVKSYIILTEALQVTEEQQLLYNRIAIQRARLIVWGENWGIDEHTADDERRNARYSGVELLQAHLKSGPRIGPEILDALNGIAELMVNQNRLVAEYGLSKVVEAKDMRVFILVLDLYSDAHGLISIGT